MKVLVRNSNFVDVSDIFYFFFSGAGGREEASEEMAGGPVLIESRGRGGVSEEEAREGEGHRGTVCREEGGGAKKGGIKGEVKRGEVVGK